MNEHYDYIICGAGLAGLSLAYRLTLGGFEDKKILLLDRDSKASNDRTWCFWDKGENIFDSIVYKTWDELDFFSSEGKIELAIEPYTYKMIRGIDFYNHCLAKVKQTQNISIKQESVVEFKSENGIARVKTDQSEYSGTYIFNSALREKVDKSKYKYVDQHFKGWIIKTSGDQFDSNRATFMDFRIDQNNEARFFYVLPTKNNEALVEVAIFSNEILSDTAYDKIIKDYIDEYLSLRKYDILAKEFGVIPMTNYPFKKEQSKNIFNIGTSGGAVKPSSGYAFKRIQEQCDDLLIKLKQDKYPVPFTRKSKYTFLDSVLLNVVQTNKCSSAEVFQRLFQKHPASLVFKFLDEESSILDDLKIVNAPPVWPFIKAAIEEMF
jgi:lycopene beta-cyclase